MPNFGQYVFQPRPLQQFDFGQGSRDVIEAHLGKRNADRGDAQLQEQRDVRRDQNTRFSAELASNRETADYTEALKRHQSAVTLVDQARKAVATGDWNTADALMGRIAETGGRVNKTMGANGRPIYDFNAPEAPSRGQLDIQGMRNQVFGGAPQPQQSQPFQVPGFGADGRRNPFESLPGASAAAMPQSSQAPVSNQVTSASGGATNDPPPGAAVDGPLTPPSGAAWLPPDPSMDASMNSSSGPQSQPAPPQTDAGGPQTMQPGSPQLTGPNPMGTPTFSPYRLDTNQLISQNASRINPYLEGFQAGVPARFQPRLNQFNAAVAGLALPPEETLKLTQPALNTLAGLMKSEVSSEATRASLGLRGQGMEFSQNQRLRDFAAKRVQNVSKHYNLTESITKTQAIDEVLALLKTPGGDAKAVAKMRDLYERGIMTDNDYDRAKSGIITHWQKFKNGVIEGFVNNGLNPDARANLRALAETASRISRDNIAMAQRQMLSRNINNRTIAREELDEIANSTADLIPQSYWSPELQQYLGMPMDQKSGPMDQSGNMQMTPATGDSLGTSPLPKSLDGRGTTSVRASASTSKRGPTVDVGGKQKTAEELTDAERESLTIPQLEHLLNGLNPEGGE